MTELETYKGLVLPPYLRKDGKDGVEIVPEPSPLETMTLLFYGPKSIQYMDGSLQHGNSGGAVRTHPNTPPLRDAEHRAKHRRRKVARASRKRNR